MTDTKEEINYKDTLNLPKTAFPMKGNGPVREPEFQKKWEEGNVYEKALLARKDSEKGRFLLHDGPPYLSSEKIHIGTALNKILKDIVVKYKTLRGYYSPYVPGYDCHGLPIENAVLKKMKSKKNDFSPIELRDNCKDFALKNRTGQEEKFKRLGVLGNWSDAYMTLHPQFEASQLELFAEMYEKGYIYRGLKPVYWSTGCQTALAEAEVEYVDNYKSPSIYVAFNVEEFSDSSLSKYSDLKIVIWTTTPWTIPANLAICVHPEFDYAVIKSKKFGNLLIAKGLIDSFNSKIEEDSEVLEVVTGASLENTKCKHPLYDRVSPIVLGDHVTLETGTGCVHTAPGHGVDDFNVGNKYGLEVLSPVDDYGKFTVDAGEDLKGLFVHKDGNAAVLQKLTDCGALIMKEDYFHSYPHCWRSKTPIIFRATEQWFCSVDKFRDKALSEIDNVNWVPGSGRNRIYSMVESRSDWCISRQRNWGVPIPAFYYYEGDEKKILMDSKTIKHLAAIVREKGTNAWWSEDISDLLPDEYKEKYSNLSLNKETDTMDVWFDSGSTHMTVVDQYEDLGDTPAELYLEGSDQHRGWFQSSLLTSVAVKGRAPYKSVLTHGFVVDENGRKMSKSTGNVIDPDKVIKQYGADILRLWVTSVDYTVDVRIGNNMLKQLSDVYRNIRNTSRFMLSNLYDFNSESDIVSYDEMMLIDKYILHKLESVKSEINKCMDSYQFYKYYQILQNFCAVDLSSFYFDLNKDRLYTAGKKSLSRRSAQTVLYTLLDSIVPMLVPVLPHMAEDIWAHYPEGIKKSADSAICLNWAEEKIDHINEDLQSEFTRMLQIKDIAYKAIEAARADKKIGKSVEVKLVVQCLNESDFKLLEKFENELETIFIVSQFEFSIEKVELEGKLSDHSEEGILASVYLADGDKCPRCWKVSTTIGETSEHSSICLDCVDALT